jgi:hypothetical protein
MFVVEQPFASDFFFRSLEKLQAPVFASAAVEEFNVANRNLNLVSDKEFVEYYRKIPEPLYCNSENGLSRVATLLPDAPFVRLAELFKNKAKFRQAVAPLYPNFTFREVDLTELQTLRYEDLPRRFVIKPSVGFLSVGVRFVESTADWERAQAEILRESAAGAGMCRNGIARSAYRRERTLMHKRRSLRRADPHPRTCPQHPIRRKRKPPAHRIARLHYGG